MDNKWNARFVAARKKFIESQFAQLNAMQRQAVLTTEGPLLLLAGAGSGKTTVLIQRIANLIRFGRASESEEVPEYITEDDVAFLEELSEFASLDDLARSNALCALDPVKPWNIIAITFTNKAANELKDRLETMLGPDGRDVWAMTFHSACCRILRKEIDRIGYSSSFTIYDSSDSERIMKDIIKNMGLDDKSFPAKYVLGAISREKDKMVTPEAYMQRAEYSGDYRLLHIAKAYQIYQEQLKSNNALDFDDIIFRTVELLRDHEEVRTYYQRKFRYVLVDEYQDTNLMQYLLTYYLAGGYENLCVVGDDDQSIYRFRGATIENILNFEKQYKAARIIRLEQNYRSTQSILNAANSVIAHNLGRKGKRLWTVNKAGEKLSVFEATDETTEADYVVRQILTASKGKNFSDHAILYRTNAQSNALEFAMKRNGIPYRIIGGTRFFDRAEIKDMLSYLCVIHNRADDLRLKRIINNPPRGIGAKSLETAEMLAHAEKKALYEVVCDPYSYGPLEKTAGKMMQFVVMLEDLAALLNDGMPLPEFYEMLMEKTGYAAMLQAKGTEEAITRLENIKELKSTIQAYVNEAESPSLTGFLEEVSLYTDLEQYDETDDTVVMMTMHSAKGLEFPTVYLVGFEDGLFPGMQAIGDREQMEEERRLCYVAITRAKEKLHITFAKQRMLYGRTTASLPSRFLREIPEDLYTRTSMVRQSTYDPFRTQANRPSKPSEIDRFMQSATPKAPCPDFKKGDTVMHTAFGRGLILSVLKLGNDALLEVAFDRVGTKKLMAKTASAHMKKISI